MPKNVPYGVWIGVASFFFGFAMIWYMWWLAILGVVGFIVTMIVAANEDEPEYVITAEEVKKVEDARFAKLAAAAAAKGEGHNHE